MRCWVFGHDWWQQRTHLQMIFPERVEVCSRCRRRRTTVALW